MFAAIQVKHSCHDHPRVYYMRLRHAYFEGKNAPGLEENPTFNRHVHELRQDRHAHKRSCRRPYAEILAQDYDNFPNFNIIFFTFSFNKIHDHAPGVLS